MCQGQILYWFDFIILKVREIGWCGEVGVQPDPGRAKGGGRWRWENEEGAETKGVDKGDMNDHLIEWWSSNVVSAARVQN